jgi:arsenate reductase (thioredoxin)
MKVLFLCPHGGAKSVMAAAYFNRLAEERQLPFEATSAAAEDPYDAVPEPVADLLQREGVDVRSFRPRHVDADEVSGAARVVTIGCDVPVAGAEQWNDVPMASEDLEGSAAAIRKHVAALMEKLGG